MADRRDGETRSSGDRKQEQDKSGDTDMTSAKINVLVFLLIDASSTVFASFLLMTGPPTQDEGMILFATIASLSILLIASAPTRVPPLYGPRVCVAMTAFLAYRCMAAVVAMAAVLRHETLVSLVSWLLFQSFYLLAAATFCTLSRWRQRPRQRRAVTSLRFSPIEEANAA